MKTKMLIFISVLLIIGMSLCIHAQDNTHEGLPAGAIARLGKGGINIMRFSPDGTHLAVGTDVCMWLYDVKDGNETPLFTGQGDQVNALTFSQDGNTLVSSGDDSPVIQFWDLKTGEKQHSIELTQQRDSVVSLAIHGSTLISLDSRGNLIYWHADTGKELSVTGNIAKFSAVAFSDDGSTFAVNVNDSKIHLWDVTTSKRKRTLIGHANLFRQQDKEILALAFSPDGEILASGSKDKNVRLWNTQTYTKIDTLREHDEWVTAIAFSDDLRTLATGDTSGEIKIWDLATRKIRTTLKGHKTTINALTFAPDGMSEYSGCLASGSADGTIRFWNPYTGKELITYTKGHTEWVKTVAFSEDDSFLVSAVYNGLVEKWDLTTFRHVSTFSEGQNDTTNSVAFSSDAKFFACISGNAMVVFKSLGSGSHIRGRGQGNLQVWDITTGEECPVPDMQRGPMSAAPAFSPNNNLIAASDYHTIRVWNRNTRNEQFRLSLDEPLFLGQLLFSPDGQILAALPAYRKIQIWDVATQNDITPDINLPANVFAFSPDSTSIATASHDDMHLWKLNASEEDVHTPLKANLFNIKPKPVLTFSPDGKTLIGSERSNLKFIIGSERRNLKMIDVETGNQTVIPSGHTEPIEAIVLSHNGKTLATASMDGTILLWDWEIISVKQ